ncbi:MAG: hypothetical protein ACP5O7_07705 [Phycisphaerae bacterium]
MLTDQELVHVVLFHGKTGRQMQPERKKMLVQAPVLALMPITWTEH